MPIQQSSSRYLTWSSSGLSFGILLVLCVYFWPNLEALSPLETIASLRNEIDYGLGEAQVVHSNVTLVPRDEYQCSKDKPCSNGACCGKSGYCGYGPTYCGSGCLADCNAVAECGQYAKTAGTECPLNTCCSQFGFVSHSLADHTRAANYILNHCSVVLRKTSAGVRSLSIVIDLWIGRY